MDFKDISQKISNIGRRMKDLSKPVGEQLEDRKEMYEDAIEGTDEILRWLRYYKKDPENAEDTFSDSITPDYTVVSVDSAVSDAPEIVSKPYKKYRRTVPLLTGDERLSAYYNNDWSNFKRRIDKHIELVKRMRQTFKQGLKAVEDAQESLNREEYKKQANEQRGDDYSIDKEQVRPDETVSDIRESIGDVLEDKIEQEIENEVEEEEKKDEEDEMSIMKTRQYVHYMVEYLRVIESSDDDPSSYYKILKDGFPEQAEVIERNIYGMRSLERIDYEKEGMITLNDGEIEYIKDRVRGNRIPDKTLEDFRDDKEYREREIERVK